MESVGLIRTLVFVIVMFAITVLPFIVILGAVYLLRRSMSKKCRQSQETKHRATERAIHL